MKHDKRIQRLEELIEQKNGIDRNQHFEFTKEEIQIRYEEAGETSEPLYVKINKRYVCIDDLSSEELRMVYRDFIDDRIKLFSESELKQMGVKTGGHVGQ